MSLETTLSIVAIALSVIVPFSTLFLSLRLNDRLQEQFKESVHRPTPIANVIIDTSASVQIHPQNLGDAVAHNYTINVRYPSESKITSIKNEYFDVKEGGIGEDYVKFFREAFPPMIFLPPICIDAEREGKVVLPREVSVVCLEQKAIMSLPPVR